jgi:(p)ppGpp synthase/HD superfamily hydrolase
VNGSLDEILACIDAPGRAVVLRARSLAGRLHAEDPHRPDGPYIDHLVRVATRIAHEYHVFDVDVLCAGLLHDALEDHPEDASYEGFARDFGPRMAGLVRAVTNPELPPDLPAAERRERYRAHVVASLDREPWARVIKLSDFADNGPRVAATVTDPDRRKHLRAKYLPLIPHLVEFTTRDDTPLDTLARAKILAMLTQAKSDLEGC